MFMSSIQNNELKNININLGSVEPLTHRPWSELIAQSVENKISHFVLGVITQKGIQDNQIKDISFICDGIHLREKMSEFNIQASSSQPQKSLSKFSYVLLKNFDFSDDGCIAQAPIGTIEEETVFDGLDEELVFSSLNPYIDNDTVTQSQFHLAYQLLDKTIGNEGLQLSRIISTSSEKERIEHQQKITALILLYCSSLNGHASSEELLTLITSQG